jgi:hypothetical protein
MPGALAQERGDSLGKIGDPWSSLMPGQVASNRVSPRAEMNVPRTPEPDYFFTPTKMSKTDPVTGSSQAVVASTAGVASRLAKSGFRSEAEERGSRATMRATPEGNAWMTTTGADGNQYSTPAPRDVAADPRTSDQYYREGKKRDSGGAESDPMSKALAVLDRGLARAPSTFAAERNPIPSDDQISFLATAGVPTEKMMAGWVDIQKAIPDMLSKAAASVVGRVQAPTPGPTADPTPAPTPEGPTALMFARKIGDLWPRSIRPRRFDAMGTALASIFRSH